MRSATLVATALVLAGCGGVDPPPGAAQGTVAVSGASPFFAGCEGTPQQGTRYAGSAVEPWLAANPTAPGHLVATWQQDRWSSGAASGLLSAVSRDGGRTWRQSPAAFSRCTGGTTFSGTGYERASDPWVTFAADGTVYQAALAVDPGTTRKAVLVARSSDGGDTWAAPQAIARDEGGDFFLDKETITADPRDARFVYAVWDRLENLTSSDPAALRGPTWFARTTDAGATWEAARIIHDPGPDAQTIANQIVVLPDGTLVNLFVGLLQATSEDSPGTIQVMRSADRGVTWTAPVVVANLSATGTTDRYTHRDVRTAPIVPAIAVDPRSGVLYVAWQDSRFSGGARDAIAVATSADGGVTWSAPRQASASGQAAAFRPALAVGPDGTVALTYYDFRFDGSALFLPLPASAWIATSADGGRTWREGALGAPFDLRLAPESDGYFLGDYTGLAHDGNGFVALYVATAPAGTAGVYAARWPDVP